MDKNRILGGMKGQLFEGKPESERRGCPKAIDVRVKFSGQRMSPAEGSLFRTDSDSKSRHSVGERSTFVSGRQRPANPQWAFCQYRKKAFLCLFYHMCLRSPNFGGEGVGTCRWGRRVRSSVVSGAVKEECADAVRGRQLCLALALQGTERLSSGLSRKGKGKEGSV